MLISSIPPQSIDARYDPASVVQHLPPLLACVEPPALLAAPKLGCTRSDWDEDDGDDDSSGGGGGGQLDGAPIQAAPPQSAKVRRPVLNEDVAVVVVAGSVPPATVTSTDHEKGVLAGRGEDPRYLTFCDRDELTSPVSHHGAVLLLPVGQTTSRYDTCLCPRQLSGSLRRNAVEEHGGTHEKRGAATSTPSGASIYSTRRRVGAADVAGWCCTTVLAWINAGKDNNSSNTCNIGGGPASNGMADICSFHATAK